MLRADQSRVADGQIAVLEGCSERLCESMPAKVVRLSVVCLGKKNDGSC